MTKDQLLEALQEGLIYEALDLPKLLKDMTRLKFAQFVIDNSGNPNALIRENMMGIHDRLVEEAHLPKTEIRHLYYDSMENLFKGLGSKGDDSVFYRAFASLYMAFILDMDEEWELGVLNYDRYIHGVEATIDYMTMEVDRRGFVPGKGWADAIGHGALLLQSLVEHSRFPMEYAGRILNCLKIHITAQESYTTCEEQRFAGVILALLEKGYSQSGLKNWIKSLVPENTAKPCTDESYLFARIVLNVKYLLAALFFALEDSPEWADLRKFIIQYEPTIPGCLHP